MVLVNRHEASMMRVARAYVSSRASAEDVVQETWIGVVRGIDRFEGRSSLKTWLFRILTNRAKTAGQREHRDAPDLDLGADGRRRPGAIGSAGLGARSSGGVTEPWSTSAWSRDLEERVVATEAVGVVRDAINALPPTQRVVIALRDVGCRGADEVATALGLSEANQRVLLHRARAKVRQRLAVHDAAAGDGRWAGDGRQRTTGPRSEGAVGT